MIALAINTKAALNSAITSNYIMAAAIAAVAIILLIIFANMVPWQTGSRDTSGSTRRTIWFILLAVTLIAQGVLSWVMFYADITKKARASSFFPHVFLSAGAACLIYVVVTLIIIKTQSTRSKLSTIF